jgi:hypothetical protein
MAFYYIIQKVRGATFMADKKDLSGLKILNAVFFVLMVAVNALANILPLNGMNTGEVAEQYSNLFTPPPFTFLIWGLIYLMLAGFILFQFGAFRGNESTYREDLIREIGPYFAISSIANAAWIFAWHYGIIGVSVVLILIILYSLSVIVFEISKYDLLPLREKIFVKYPFSIYFGWITVAVIANIAAFLVSISWDGFGWPQSVWTVILLVIGLLITAAVTLKNRDIAYGLVVIWAYSGILYRHLSKTGYAGQYPAVIWTLILSLVLLVGIVVYLYFRKKKK